ncbi:MAG: alpha/beta hydrolase [Myxococcales bacterium]
MKHVLLAAAVAVDVLTGCTNPTRSTAMSTVSPATTLRLFVDDAGPQGTLPVVFLHSAGGDSSHFADQLVHLRRTRRALAVDLRGHGRSPRGSSFAIDDAAADVTAALAARGIERFVLVGHSWGGAVAVAIAGRLPAQAPRTIKRPFARMA